MKLIATSKEKGQQKKQLSQLDETLNDFVFGNSVNVNVSESENMEQHSHGQPNHFERVDNSALNQVIENNIDDQITRAVRSAVIVSKIACTSRV